MFKNSSTLLPSRCGAWFLSPCVWAECSDWLLTKWICRSDSVQFPTWSYKRDCDFLFVVSLVSLALWGNSGHVARTFQQPYVVCKWAFLPRTLEELRPPADSRVTASPWRWIPRPWLSCRCPQSKSTSSAQQLYEWLSGPPANLLLNFWPAETMMIHFYCFKVVVVVVLQQ